MPDRTRNPNPNNRRAAGALVGPPAPVSAPSPVDATVVPAPPTTTSALATVRQDGSQTFPGGIQVPDPHAPPQSARYIDPVLAPRPVLTANGLNLFTGGDFESSNPVLNATPPGFTLGTNTSLFWKNTNQHSGLWCAQVTNGFAGAVYSIAATHTVQGGFPYRFQAYLQATNNVATWQVVIVWKDAAGATISTYTSPNTATVLNSYVLVDSLPAVSPSNAVSATWTLQTTASVPAGDTHYIDDITFSATTGAQGDTVVTGSGGIRSQNYQTGVAGWAIDGLGNSEFNNVTLRGQLTGIDGPNLIRNPSIETNTNGWTTVVSGETLSRVNTIAHAGTWSLEANAGATPGNTMSADGACDAVLTQGQAYRYQAWVAPSVNNRVVGLQVFYYDVNGANISGVTDSATQFLVATANTWTRVTGTFVPPTAAVKTAAIRAFVSTLTGNLNANELMHVDDAGVYAVSDSTLGRMKTAAAGERVEIYSAGQNKVRFYSGDPLETQEGFVQAYASGDTGGGRWGSLVLQPARLSATATTANIQLYSEASNTPNNDKIVVAANVLQLGKASPGTVTLIGEVKAYNVYTSSTRPAAPTAGEQIYETNTGNVMVYTTATTGWRAPWNTAWGRVGTAKITANSAAFTTLVDITGLSVTITAVANRIYRIMFTGFAQSSVVNDNMRILIADGASTQLQRQDVTSYVANNLGNATMWVETTPAAGSVTYKIQAIRQAGTGTSVIAAATTSPAIISVDDIGPNAAPA